MLWALWGFGKGIFGTTALLRHKGKTAFQLLEDRHVQNSAHPNVNCFTIISSLLLIFCLAHWAFLSPACSALRHIGHDCSVRVPARLSHDTAHSSLTLGPSSRWFLVNIARTEPTTVQFILSYLLPETPPTQNHFTVSDSHELFRRHFV